MKATIIQAGSLLLAEPFMADLNFKRSVILICEHNDEGTVGFTLNHPSEQTLDEAFEDIPDFQAPLYYGGPVQPDTLHYVHTLANLDEAVEIVPGLYWGGNFETLKTMINNGEVGMDDIRFFLGYSGWGDGQLQGEMKEHSWMTHQARPSHVFTNSSTDLWKSILKEKGGDYSIMVNFPEDPALN